jgi:hypothetical protein
MASQRIGRIWLQGPDGKVHETALYDVPLVLREPVLHVNGGIYQQVTQSPGGHYVYRYEGPLGNRPSNPDVKAFRTANSPDWDGPPVPVPIATMGDVRQHFERLMVTDGSVSLRELHRHFLAAHTLQPYKEL